jgi:hypothetical protein
VSRKINLGKGFAIKIGQVVKRAPDLIVGGVCHAWVLSN